MNDPMPIHPANWSGDERRSIPVHVLNYIDTKLDEHRLAAERRYSELKQSIDELEEKAEGRHADLLKRIDAFISHQDQVNSAFLKDHNGHPDYHGHNKDHYERLKRSRSWGEFWTDSAKKVATGAIYSACIVIGLVLWEAFKEAVKK